MKRFLGRAPAGALLAAAWAAALPVAASADTLAKVAASNRMTLAYREYSVPFSYLEGPGQPIGLTVELSNAIAAEVKKRLGKPDLRIDLMAVSGQNRIPLLANGTIDLECGSTTNTAARAREVAFSINYFYAGTRLMVRKDSGIRDYADLQGRRLATPIGTTNLLVMRRYSETHKLDLEIVPVKDHAEALLLLESGRVAAYASDDVILYGARSTSKNPQALDIVGEALQVEPYACMVRKDDPAFKALVDGVIADMMKSGAFEALYRRWFMAPIPPRGTSLDMPMGPALRENLTALSDQPAP